ncbi:MAG TPA: glycosyltransferase family 39 protein [Kofleriaceae bacterium]|nr:glycosyltransferase family 39 protein [Kofleriaceae bacterium]
MIGLYLVISAFEPFRTNWGDPWSDGNAMTAGRYFARDGFWKTAFTPILDVGPLGNDSLRYTHYPPLPDLVAGVIQKAIGSGHLAIHRLFAIAFSAIGLALLFKYLRALWGEGLATLSVLLIATNLLFIQYADTVHHIPLYSMTGFACLWAALRWLDDRRPRALIAVSAATFLCFLSSYDFYFFLPIMILATVWLRGAKVLRGHGLALVVVFAGSGLASIIVKNLLVIWAVGYSGWRSDLIFQFFERATATRSRVYKQMLGDIVFWRLWRFGSPLIFAAILAQVVGVIDLVRGRKPLMSMHPLILLAAALPFMFVFSQLVAEQYHPMLLLLPFVATAIAVLVRTVWTASPAIASLMVVLYLGWQAWGFHLFKKTFLRQADVAAVGKALESDHHSLLVSNIFPDGPVRFLWNRHLFGMSPDLIDLRETLEIYGMDSPLTIVQLRHMRKHMYDKGLFGYFARERQVGWIARPDYYRNAWGQRFDAMDKEFDEALTGLGRVVHQSNEMIVRSVSNADLDAFQRSRLPATTPRVIDFETVASEPFKVRGISPHTAGTAQLPGYAWLYVRQPAKVVFTLRGYEYPPIGPPIHTSTLQMRLPADRALHMAIDMSSPARIQTVTVRMNGHALGSQTMSSQESMTSILGPQKPTVVRMELDVPVTALRPDGLAVLDLEFSSTANRNAVRLHRIELASPSCPPPPAAN